MASRELRDDEPSRLWRRVSFVELHLMLLVSCVVLWVASLSITLGCCGRPSPWWYRPAALAGIASFLGIPASVASLVGGLVRRRRGGRP